MGKQTGKVLHKDLHSIKGGDLYFGYNINKTGYRDIQVIGVGKGKVYNYETQFNLFSSSDDVICRRLR